MAFVGLIVDSAGGEVTAGISNEVSMLAIWFGGFASRGTVADFISWTSGEGVGAISAVVAERRRDCGELPESIEERLGDFRWAVTCPEVESTLPFR